MNIRQKVKKDLSLETLRGLAIILMVAGHAIGNDSSHGLRVADDSFWRYIYYTTVNIRLPLFTALSGYLFGMRPVSFATFPQMVKGKIFRILLPFISVATLQYLLQSFVLQANHHTDIHSLWQIYFFSYGQFWFSQSIFLIFIFSGLVDSFKGFLSWRRWLIFILCGFVLKEFLAGWDFFSIYGFGKLLGFFLLGLGVSRLGVRLTTRANTIGMLAVLFVSVVFRQVDWFFKPELGFSPWLRAIVNNFEGIAAIYLLFYFKKPVRWLAWIGYYAYGIFLFHVIATAGSRIVLMSFGLHKDSQLFIISMVMGLFLPILIERILEKNSLMSLVFLGIRSTNLRKPNKA